MELDVELKMTAYKSSFENINFITLIIWILLFIWVMAAFFYGGTEFDYLFTQIDL